MNVVRMMAAVLLLWSGAGCRPQHAAIEWEPGAVRAVARDIQQRHPNHTVVALSRAGSVEGHELPWGVRQSLTTGGVEVVDAIDTEPATIVIVFEASTRADGDWLIDTSLAGGGAQQLDVPAAASWRVRCNESCTVVDVQTQATQ